MAKTTCRLFTGKKPLHGDVLVSPLPTPPLVSNLLCIETEDPRLAASMAAAAAASLQKLLRRSHSATVTATLRQLQAPPPLPPPLAPLHQPYAADELPSRTAFLDSLWVLSSRTENARQPHLPPPVFPSYPFGLYLGPIPWGSSVESEEEAADSSDASAMWADSVKKKRKRKMNKHKYKKLRKRLRRQS